MDAEVKTALVDELPPCDLCKMEGKNEPAEYDARTRTGQWGNLCQDHFDQQGCRLGLGFGQKLVLRGSAKQPDELIRRADALCRRCGQDCPDECWNKETGRFRVLDNPDKIGVMISLGMYCEEV